ncbi:amidohydrolase family protein [Acidobacteriota bacterium]
MKGKMAFWTCSLSFLAILFSIACSSGPSEHYDVLITNAKIVDGTGKAAYTGSVAINGEKIAAVGNIKGDADITIDAKGLIVSPGFIDPHSHADWMIYEYPLAENLIMQGITTVLAGNCGQSPGPTKNSTLGEWLSKVEGKGLSINLAQLLGHSVLRVAVMGDDFKREATADEIERMKTHVAEAMESGAFGMSSFFDPAPGEYASHDEMVALLKVVQQHNGFYVPHTRHIQSQMPSDDLEEYGYGIYHGPAEDIWIGRFRGYKEAVELSRKANIPLHIAHFSNAYIFPQPHPDLLEKAAAEATLIEIIDKAREEGLDVTYDVIPWTSSIAGPRKLITDFYGGENIALAWTTELKIDEFIEGLKTGDIRKKIRDVYDNERIKVGMVHTKADPYWYDSFKILTCANKAYEEKTIGEIAETKQKDALETIFDILVEDPETIWIQHIDKRDSKPALPVMLNHSVAMPCTDVTVFPMEFEIGEENPYAQYGLKPAPIFYGLYAHYIGTYVREENILTIEEAVRKATSVPAERFGFEGRGVLAEGNYADIVLFDLSTIKMTGDYLTPNKPPDGIEYVFVNGKVAYKNKKHTGEKSGKVLRHN